MADLDVCKHGREYGGAPCDECGHYAPAASEAKGEENAEVALGAALGTIAGACRAGNIEDCVAAIRDAQALFATLRADNARLTSEVGRLRAGHAGSEAQLATVFDRLTAAEVARDAALSCAEAAERETGSLTLALGAEQARTAELRRSLELAEESADRADARERQLTTALETADAALRTVEDQAQIPAVAAVIRAALAAIAKAKEGK